MQLIYPSTDHMSYIINNKEVKAMRHPVKVIEIICVVALVVARQVITGDGNVFV